MGKILYAEAVTAGYYANPRLDDLDSNQRAFAEKAMDTLAFTHPLATEDFILCEAMRQAVANLPLRQDAARSISEMRAGPAYCYLAFHGLDGIAQFLKIGMSRHPERRLYGMATGNPLDCLWAFTAKLPTAKQAYHAEQSLLRHMEERKRRGEWIEIGATDEAGAVALARQLGAVMLEAEPDAGEFTPFGYRDGH